MCDEIKFGVGGRVHFSPFSQLAVISKPSTYLRIYCIYRLCITNVCTFFLYEAHDTCITHTILPWTFFQRWHRDIVINFRCVHNHLILLDRWRRHRWQQSFPNRSFWYGHWIYPNQYVYLWFHPLRSKLRMQWETKRMGQFSQAGHFRAMARKKIHSRDDIMKITEAKLVDSCPKMDDFQATFFHIRVIISMYKCKHVANLV